MKIGDEVRVRSDSLAYGGAFHGCYGVVKFYVYGDGGNIVGVKLSNLVNKRSAKGVYYFNERELLMNGETRGEADKRYDNPFSIKDVIFNEPATIVLWADGSKTVVKCDEDDIFDPEKGLAMAISKKALGNQGNYYNTFKKYLPEEEVDDESVHNLFQAISDTWLFGKRKEK